MQRFPRGTPLACVLIALLVAVHQTATAQNAGVGDGPSDVSADGSRGSERIDGAITGGQLPDGHRDGGHRDGGERGEGQRDGGELSAGQLPAEGVPAEEISDEGFGDEGDAYPPADLYGNVIRLHGNRLTVNIVEMPLREFLLEVGRQAGAQVRLEGVEERSISESFARLPLEEALRRVLGGRNFTLTYGRAATAAADAPAQLKILHVYGGSGVVVRPVATATTPASTPTAAGPTATPPVAASARKPPPRLPTAAPGSGVANGDVHESVATDDDADDDADGDLGNDATQPQDAPEAAHTARRAVPATPIAAGIGNTPMAETAEQPVLDGAGADPDMQGVVDDGMHGESDGPLPEPFDYDDTVELPHQVPLDTNVHWGADGLDGDDGAFPDEAHDQDGGPFYDGTIDGDGGLDDTMQ